MPANASVEYINAQKKYDNAATPQEKLIALQEMDSYSPKHKGGENLRKEMSKKIAKLKSEIEKQKDSTSKKGSAPSLNVKKDGAGQVAIVGLPNSGKSTLLNSLTEANAQVADYPFTTIMPEVGMMEYKGAKVQLVEIPAIVEGSSEGKAQGVQLLSLIRNADGIVFTAEKEEDKKILLRELENADILVNRTRPNIELKQTGFKGITIAGKHFLKMTETEFTDLLKNSGYHNVSVILGEEATREKIAEVLNQKIVYKKAIFLNPKEKIDTEQLKEKIFFLLGKILVYTKKSGEKPDLSDPLVIEKNETIEEVANHLHRDFSKSLKFAKVWGSTKFEGQRVPKDYQLQHGDIFEIV